MTDNAAASAAAGTTDENPDRNKVWLMFDRIAHRYDLLNRLLSMGQDVVWRKKVAKHMKPQGNQHVLDLATGTCDLLFALDDTGKVEKGVGIDMSTGMLKFGENKIQQRGKAGHLTTKVGDACVIPEGDNLYDLVTISFGIRNVMDVSQSMREMVRVLKPGGRALILEFSLPGNALFRKLYLFYFRHILPRIGGIISGDNYAYSYLNKTVETFPYGEEFMKLMRNAGFKEVKGTQVTFGIATIYQGDVPESGEGAQG